MPVHTYGCMAVEGADIVVDFKKNDVYDAVPNGRYKHFAQL